MILTQKYSHEAALNRNVSHQHLSHIMRKPAFLNNRKNKVQIPKASFLIAHLLSIFTIRITCPCKFDPLTPHFYAVKLGCTEVYIVILVFALEHGLWVLVRTASVRRF